MKKIFLWAFNVLLVAVPVALLAEGLFVNIDSLWKALMAVGIVGVLAFAYKEYNAVRSHKESAETAREAMTIIGSIPVIISIFVQVLCHTHNEMWFMGVAIWLVILLTVEEVNLLTVRPSMQKLAKIMAIYLVGISVYGGIAYLC